MYDVNCYIYIVNKFCFYEMIIFAIFDLLGGEELWNFPR